MAVMLWSKFIIEIRSYISLVLKRNTSLNWPVGYPHMDRKLVLSAARVSPLAETCRNQQAGLYPKQRPSGPLTVFPLLAHLREAAPVLSHQTRRPAATSAF